jgi:hypothetical protein
MRREMPENTWIEVCDFFGSEFVESNRRSESYSLIETIVSDAPRSVSGTPRTEEAIAVYRPLISGLTDQQLAFLLTHSGFIPDHYEDDSSDETLYSKFVEVLVAEWGSRLNIKTEIPTAKSSTEDVTFIFDGSHVIVADVKCYRLGRSQAAPNVKDVIKAEDFNKWASRHGSREAVGGLVVFPSRFDFKKGSDVYLYASNPNPGKRILILFFEHLAYLLLHAKGLPPGAFFSILHEYGGLFERASKNRLAYWSKIEPQFEKLSGKGNFAKFYKACQAIIDDHVKLTLARISDRIAKTKTELEDEISSLSERELRNRLLPSELSHRCGADAKRLANIQRFRL